MRRVGVVLAAVLVSLVLTAGLVALVRLARPAAPVAAAGWGPPAALPRSEPLGPDRLAFDSDRTGNFELFVMDASGGPATQLTADPAYDSWGPRISPDRATLVFTRAPRGVHDTDPTQASLWAMAAAGGPPVLLRPDGLDGWGLLGHPEWSPDGQRLVLVGGDRINAQIFVTDALGQSPRAVTDRPGTNIDPAFTPDGTGIVFVGCPSAVCTPRRYEVYQVPATGGAAKRLTNDELSDYDPMYTPDGRRLAWLTNIDGRTTGVWDVRVREPDGALRRLVGDDGITSRPQFSRDGRYVYVHRIPPGGRRFDVFRLRLDGSGLTNLTAGQPGNNEYPSP